MKMMTEKERIHKSIDSLPDSTSLEDAIQALYVNSKFAKGETEITQGKGIRNDEAVTLMKSWQK